MVIVMEEFNIPFDKAQTVNVYNESVKSEYVYGSAEYRKIMDCWNETVKGAHDMPAFGVSINNLTVKEMQKGVWLEFDFKKQLEHNGMPYENPPSQPASGNPVPSRHHRPRTIRR